MAEYAVRAHHDSDRGGAQVAGGRRETAPTTTRAGRPAVLPLALLLSACDGSEATVEGTVATRRFVEELRIGVVDAPVPAAFGFLHGLAVLENGRIVEPSARGDAERRPLLRVFHDAWTRVASVLLWWEAPPLLTRPAGPSPAGGVRRDRGPG